MDSKAHLLGITSTVSLTTQKLPLLFTDLGVSVPWLGYSKHRVMGIAQYVAPARRRLHGDVRILHSSLNRDPRFSTGFSKAANGICSSDLAVRTTQIRCS